MNILAHLYLSNGINQRMLGNYIGDFVKGNQYLNYPKEIQQGILLHRQIDSYTDNHATHKQTRDWFRPMYGLFSGIVVDIVYDHCLAKNWTMYSKQSLNDYSQDAYSYILNHEKILPPPLKKITPTMVNNNWLMLYKSTDGIKRVLQGMAVHASLPNHVDFAIETLITNYKKIEEEFIYFFDDLNSYVNI